MVAIVGRRGPVCTGSSAAVAGLAASLPRKRPLVVHSATGHIPIAPRDRHPAVTAQNAVVSQLDLGSGLEMPTFNVELERSSPTVGVKLG